MTDGSSRVRNERSGAPSGCPLDGALHNLVEPELARREVMLLSAGQLDELPTSVVIDSSSSRTSVSELRTFVRVERPGGGE